jgi:hypothetical protein
MSSQVDFGFCRIFDARGILFYREQFFSMAWTKLSGVRFRVSPLAKTTKEDTMKRLIGGFDFFENQLIGMNIVSLSSRKSKPALHAWFLFFNLALIFALK